MKNEVEVAYLILVGLVAAYDREVVTPSTPFNKDNIVFLRSCWEQNVIPFYLDPTFSKSEIKFIYKMIAEFHKQTCLRWVEYKTAFKMTDGTSTIEVYDKGITVKDYVSFSKVGYGRCRTTRVLLSNDTFIAHIKLLDNCFKQNAVMHEMMHALGFHHEHQRADRSCYVSVTRDADNLPGYRIEPHEPWLERYPYDKYSVLHYARSHIMVSRIERRRHMPDFLGNAHGQLTHLDLSKVMYKFCAGPHYCDVSPEDCRVAADWRQRMGCVRPT